MRKRNHSQRLSTPASAGHEIGKFVYEIGHLKRVPRAGWSLIGITDPESVAEHSFRVAVLGYLLAQLEGADPGKTLAICLFHDVHESRINDLHRLARRYIGWNGVEQEIVGDQVARLPQEIGNSIVSLLEDYEADASTEAQLAHDADQLECLAQAYEYMAQGLDGLDDWIVSCTTALHSDAAKQIANDIASTHPGSWWKGLKATKPAFRKGPTGESPDTTDS